MSVSTETVVFTFLWKNLVRSFFGVTLMSAELAHQKADMHFCVALHRKVRIRLHPSIETNCGITNILDGSLPNVASITLIP